MNPFIEINILFFIYSLMSVLGKLAARENTFNIRFVVLYGSSLLVMGIYAIFWQQIIKKLPLMVAYANKSIVLIWGMIWGIVFFGETVTIGKMVGLFIVVSGVVLFATSEGSGSV